MGTILGKGFAQALMHTVNTTRAFGTHAIDSMHLCLCKTLSQDCPYGEIRHSLIVEHKIAIGKSAFQWVTLPATIEKCFPQNHFSIVDRSRDLSTIEKWF